jgi:hypothetical protein
MVSGLTVCAASLEPKATLAALWICLFTNCRGLGTRSTKKSSLLNQPGDVSPKLQPLNYHGKPFILAQQ